MKHMKPFVLAITLLLFLTAFPAMATMVYSGKLDLVGPDFNIDINKDGSSDFTTGWRTWAFGNGFSQSGYDAAMNFDIRFLNSELAGFGGYPGAKAPLDYGQLIGPTPPTGLLWSFNSNDSMLGREFWGQYILLTAKSLLVIMGTVYFIDGKIAPAIITAWHASHE